MLIPRLLARGLSRVLKDSREDAARTITLPATHRYVIFSDHHKGANTGADDFQFSKPTYLTALDYYLREGYSLIILGDAEELWEESIETVVSAHREVFESEARFHQHGRYLRVFGNHDSNWASKGQVETHLHKFFPGLKVHEGLVFRYEDADPENSGEIFMVHGHQGTLDSEFFAPLARRVVRAVWRTVQILIKNTGKTPGNTADLRGKHDTLMYEWARKQGKLLLIAGHTHRSVWSSKTLVEQKQIQLEALQIANNITPIPDYETQRQAIRTRIKALLLSENNQLKRDTIKTEGVYFNSGCCCFNNGQVTAYELVDNELKLVRWLVDSEEPDTLGRGRLGNLFFVVD